VTSRGQLLTIRNFYELMNGIVTPVQMEGLRLLLTPFPQEEFNQTEDRKVAQPSLGATCLDCHANFHSNGAFHLTPDVRPQSGRFRLDTTSLRGMFNQQIHGSKRSLRFEDFAEQLTDFAKQANIPLPNELDPNHKAMRAELEKLSGAEFDKAYMRGQVVDHQKTVVLLQGDRLRAGR
jgi:cytochrome c peroxidase